MDKSSWYDSASFYHIYPLGYCGCPAENDFQENPGCAPILRVLEQIPTIKAMGFTAVYFGPVFSSTRHGYDTADYRKIDERLGTNADFSAVCAALHENGIRVVLDGVFNHVGRDFWAFEDVKEHKFDSIFKDWFHIRGGNSNYNDGFHYDGWEGHYDLVRLNLHNPAVRECIKSAVSGWCAEFDLDGLRLDVAYCLELDFLKELRAHCKGLKPDFWLMGETLHGDYNKWMNPEMLDSVTNYECYKGLYSSFNDLNMFEIAHSLNRQFGAEDWCLYRGKRLYCFVDNHDVSRIATILSNKKHLPLIYTLLFAMPGVPGVYYDSEYSAVGDKRDGDHALRQKFTLEGKKTEGLAAHIAKLAHAHGAYKPLYAGDYRQVFLRNKSFAFSRSADGETAYALINAGDEPEEMALGGAGVYTDIFTGEKIDVGAPVKLAGLRSMLLVKQDD